jgi:ElaB/YqjD/DUF883 family membrane-anchored ribosome-binding protein
VTKRTDAGHGPKSKAASVANASSQSKKATRREDAAGEERHALLANNEVSQATAELIGAIRRNPLAAVGIALTTGLVLALLARE